MLRDMSYMEAVATAFTRVSEEAAVSAMPVRPQMPMRPIFFRSTYGKSPR